MPGQLDNVYSKKMVAKVRPQVPMADPMPRSSKGLQVKSAPPPVTAPVADPVARLSRARALRRAARVAGTVARRRAV